MIDASDWGATGNGVYDDAPAIQAALNTAAGNTVVLRPGHYRLATPVTLPSYTTLTGPGVADNNRGATLEPDQGVDAILLPHGLASAALTNLAIHGGRAGIRGLGEASGIDLHHLAISSCSSHGIQTDVLEEFDIRRVKIIGCTGHGWHAGRVGQSNGRTERGTITGLRIDSCQVGALLDSQVGYASSLTFTNCTFVATRAEALLLNTVRESVFQTVNVENAGTAADNTVDAVRFTGGCARLMFANATAGLSGVSPNAQRYAYTLTGSGHTFIGCTGAARTGVWNPGTATATFMHCAGTGLPV